MSVAILPHGYPCRKFVRLSSIPLADAVLLGEPSVDKGSQNLLGDLTADDHLVMMVSSKSLLAKLSDLKCRVSLVLAEPPAIQRRYYQAMPFLASRYDSVFTYSESLLHQVRNARHIVHGGCSIREERRLADKIGGVSMLASTKRATTGHILRHRIANQVKQSNLPVDLLGRGYRTVECVSEALSPFSFSIVIENSRYCGYFTEKLIDCLYCRTIPIYWGDPMVGKVFDTRGIVECNSEEDIINAVKSLSTNLYEKMLPFVEKNFEQAINYRKHMLTRAARELQTPCAHLNAA